MENIKDRFLRYVAVDTQSDESSDSQPSAKKELILLEMLRDELREMGVSAELDQWGYVMASIPANTDAKVPAIGFIAHVDTSPDAPGNDIRPQIIENYDGTDIPLRGVPGMSLKTSEFPEILRHVGETVITTDGTTLLGADDKAGVAEIMDAVQYIVNHPEFKHGEIKIGFTPDEPRSSQVRRGEVRRRLRLHHGRRRGRRTRVRELQRRRSLSPHPGPQRPSRLRQGQDAQLPADRTGIQRPAARGAETRIHRRRYEGFIHIVGFKGTVEESTLNYIIRDHDRSLFEKKKAEMLRCAEFINGRYGAGTVEITIRDQYYNMREQVEPHYHVVEKAVKAMEMAGVEPHIQPIRGGTDGANLSFKGLPCPNIFAGGLNFHGKYEWVSVQSMEKASAVILNIIRLYAEQ